MRILFQPYATKTDIRKLMGGGRWSAVSKVFEKCKQLESDPLNLRPSKVPSHLVFEVLGLNYKFALQQYKEQHGTAGDSLLELSME